ncbi:MAG: hypothetical protein HUU21_10015 [Polyangiaceae bacterium]|nr:hypothetical protein [Polyangiaceae bacterium]
MPIFMKSCGTGDNACHSEVAYGASKDQACRGWLSLKDMPLGAKYYGGMLDGQSTGCPDRTLYERLTELDAWQVCDNNLKRYIVPCDVNASYLFDKIDDGPYCGEVPGKTSAPMPSGKVMDPGEREIVRAWILAGTPRVNGDVVDCGGGAGGSGGAGGGPNGQAPQAQINHPGDMEMRPANQDIPFIGVATDAEDGDLGGGSLVWTSNVSGVIGTGLQFNAPLPAGTHVITLTATDSDKNTGTDSLTLYIQ